MTVSIEALNGVIWLRGAGTRKPFDERKVRRNRGRFAPKPKATEKPQPQPAAESSDSAELSWMNSRGLIEYDEDVREVVHQIEDKLRLIKTHEEFRVIDPDTGKVTMKKKGDKDRITIEKSERRSMQGMVFTHNHPSGHSYDSADPHSMGTSFSIQDIFMGIACGLKEMRAISPGHRHSLRIPEGWVDQKYDKLIKNTKSSQKYDAEDLRGKVELGMMTKAEAVADAFWSDIQTIQRYTVQEFQGQVNDYMFKNGWEQAQRFSASLSANATHVIAKRITEELELDYRRSPYKMWEPYPKDQKSSSDLKVKASKFDESKVKRDRAGRFAPKSGGGTAPQEEPQQKLDRVVRQLEDKIRTLEKHEEGYLVNPDTGEVVHHLKGESTQIEFPKELNGNMAGLVFTHNHPRGWRFDSDDTRSDIRSAGSSFSVEDIHAMVAQNFKEMRAVSPGHRHSLSMQPEFIDNYFKFLEKNFGNDSSFSWAMSEIEAGRMTKSHVVGVYVGGEARKIHNNVRNHFQNQIDSIMNNDGYDKALDFSIIAEAITAHVVVKKIVDHFGFIYKREVYEPWETSQSSQRDPRQTGKKSTSTDRSSLMPSCTSNPLVLRADSAGICLIRSSENVEHLTRSHWKSGTVSVAIESHTKGMVGSCLSLDPVKGIILKKFDESKVRRDELGRFAEQEDNRGELRGEIRSGTAVRDKQSSRADGYTDRQTTREALQWILKNGAERVTGMNLLGGIWEGKTPEEKEASRVEVMNNIARAVDDVIVANGLPKLSEISLREDFTRTSHAWVNVTEPNKIHVNLAAFDGGPRAYEEKLKGHDESKSRLGDSKKQQVSDWIKEGEETLAGLEKDLEKAKAEDEGFVRIRTVEDSIQNTRSLVEDWKWELELPVPEYAFAGQSIRDLMIHEIGHVLHLAIQDTMAKVGKSIDERLGGNPKDKVEIYDLGRAVGWHLGLGRKGIELARRVSSYAETNSLELFAECFCLYHTDGVQKLPAEVRSLIKEVIEMNKARGGSQ